MTSSPACQSIGVVTPFRSPSCKLSMTLNTSALFRPVDAGYDIVSLIFLFGSMMKTERIVNAISGLAMSSSAIMSYRYATLRAASAMMGNLSVVCEMSFMSSIHLSCEPRSFALYTPIRVSIKHHLFFEQASLTNPIILTPLDSNSSFNFANAPSSVVQTGVKSAG
jgi:hypothetical protein